MKEGSEGDGGGSSDDVPTSRDADSTVSNGGTHRMGVAPGGLSLGGTTLANALLGITMDRGPANGGAAGNGSNSNNNSVPHVDALFGIHSTSATKGAKAGDSNGRDKQFVCNICHRSFGYKHVLQNHERTHTGEKPFECKECHKRFTRDHHLKTHMRLHTGEKPYHCSHCERQFVQVANLRRHLRVHTGERPYSCKLCPSRFSDSNQLKAHLLIHEGKKPFECTKCHGHFRRRHHLVHHKCPRDEANIGKPRRGRRPKAYEELPTLLSPVLQERLSTPVPDLPPPPPPAVTVGLTSVITRGPSPPLVPQPAHMSARRNTHPIHHPLLGLGGSNGHFHPEQAGPLDMTVSSASAPVSVIVPLVAYNHHHHRAACSVEGVLDLSNSRSDSEAEPIEEEVDEEDGCVDEGIDSDSDEEEEEEHRLRMIPCSWKQRGDLRHRPEDLRRRGDRYDGSEGENGGSNQLALQLTTTS